MHRIIDSLATIEFDEDLNAVIVNFLKPGIPSMYEDTLSLAYNLPGINRSDLWLLTKDRFDDISPESFLKILRNWRNTLIAGGTSFYEQEKLNMFVISAICAGKYKAHKNAIGGKIRSFAPFSGISLFSSKREAIQTMKHHTPAALG